VETDRLTDRRTDRGDCITCSVNADGNNGYCPIAIIALLVPVTATRCTELSLPVCIYILLEKCTRHNTTLARNEMQSIPSVRQSFLLVSFLSFEPSDI